MSEKSNTKKSLITKSMVKMVQDCIDSIKKIDKVNLSKRISFAIGSIDVIKPVNEKPWLRLGSECDKEYLKTWRSDVGGILLKELNKNDDHMLFVISMDKFDVLSKRIRENEVKEYVQNGMIHILIGDASYTIIKIVKKGSQFSTHDSNDYEIEREETEPDSTIIDVKTEPQEPSEEQNHYQLF